MRWKELNDYWITGSLLMFKFKILAYLLFILIAISSSLIAKDNYSIASSPKDTSYYILSKSIEQIINNNPNSKYSMKTLPTVGSVGNIKMLLNRKADFAIIQNDIAFFAKNGLSSFRVKENRLRLVMPMFKEPIFLTRKPCSHSFLIVFT